MNMFDESNSEDEDIQEALAVGKIKPGLIIEEQKKNFINNKAGLKDKIKEFSLDKFKWIERFDLANEPAPLVGFNDQENSQLENDDFNRELKFYRQAQATVLEGLAILRKLSIPTRRPDDYFAEMAKSDEHMKKVRAKLLEKKISMEKSEKAKKLREMRKYGKKVQKENMLKRQKEKKEMLDSVKKFRKGQIDRLDLFDETIERQPKNSEPAKGKQQFKPNKRREYKNKRFGFGGQKKRSKYNTADSAADMGDFSAKRAHGKGPGKRNIKHKGQGTRPGKSKRKNLKNRNK
ncbi:rRNA-processing protein EBP2 [Biomphalaria glabrata]|uniref:Probable rRNA-processing protein EBP2 n=1 Tax=Biomphalaria glabrata TaxID=6526 RepID=A0A9W3ABD2_BIOGL|nr:probable rRNA-processing protein EBP2 [Biomphalaria glabrata]KAI8754805.1 putative rRNA-processing protein EBP2 [Biomphalaria glabrata]KAI8773449.1 rRNA-processing protein EBP2 [Biomphalaria glabrata]